MSSTLLGSYHFIHKNFELDSLQVQNLKQPARRHLILKTIVQKIIEIPEPAFLLPSLLNAFNTINNKKWLKDPLNMATFEFWLNQFSTLSLEEEMLVRGKIAGKKLPRDIYQRFFPIGMNKSYPGTHFVSAHLSPDLDTTIASFIGWIDAFAAKVGRGEHIWSLPGGPSDPSYPELFKKLWGENPFPLTASKTPTLALKARDLMTRKGMKEVQGSVSINEIDKGLHENAILLVDSEGYFIGDWHAKDAEIIRPVLILFKSLLRQFESEFSIRILRFFSDSKTTIQVYAETFQTKIPASDALRDLNEEEKDRLNILLQDVLHVSKGLEGTFEDLALALQKKEKTKFNQFKELVRNIDQSKDESRQVVFQAIENLIFHLNQAIVECRMWVEELSTAIDVKLHLTKPKEVALNLQSSFEEIRTKMESQDYLPVLEEEEQKLYPIGIIFKNALNRLPLGTVSLRDFSNFEEVHMASYLNVISVIDHHKTAIQTPSPALIIVGDAQSCNTLVAEQLFLINESKIEQGYYIHPDRMIAEYFSCLYAIIDDTDFLSKVSARDIICVVHLLNQLKFLISGSFCIDLSDLPKDNTFIHTGTKRILQHPDMFSIYEKIIQEREQAVQTALIHFNDSLFSDTKEQNGCARIGQTKLFSSNFQLFEKKKEALRTLWCQKAKQAYTSRPDIALHLHMISTIPSTQELYSKQQKNDHQDELWIWMPEDSTHAEALLSTFLNSFLESPDIKKKALSVEVFDDAESQLEHIFEHNFLSLPLKKNQGNKKFAIIYIKAGSLNSRKSMVSPYLPKRVC